MSKIIWKQSNLSILLFISCLVLLSAAERKPNVVLILADDQAWGDLSLHGNENIRTAQLDSLARDGAEFSRFYVSAVCAPTRASLLTGRYHWYTGVLGVERGLERLNLDEVTLADILKDAGYATGCFGKWHNGSHYPYHPLGRGFDEFYGFCSGHWANYFDTKMDHNGKEVQGRGFIADDLTDKAIAFIEKNKQKPFFCYLPYNTPHSPFQVPDKFFDELKQRGITARSRYSEKKDEMTTLAALAMCENLDWNVGRVLTRLKQLNLENDTLVIYLSDNGPNSWRWNNGFKGKKSSVDEGGLRVPFLMRWLGKIEPGLKSDQLVGHIDLVPTLCDLLNIDFERSHEWHGVSFRSLLETSGESLAERYFYSVQNRKISVRKGDYMADKKTLFNIKEDPGQRVDLSKEKPGLFQKMKRELFKLRAALKNHLKHMWLS